MKSREKRAKVLSRINFNKSFKTSESHDDGIVTQRY